MRRRYRCALRLRDSVEQLRQVAKPGHPPVLHGQNRQPRADEREWEYDEERLRGCMGAAWRLRLLSVAAAKSAQLAAAAMSTAAAATVAAASAAAAVPAPAAAARNSAASAAGVATLLPRPCRAAKQPARSVRLHVLATARERPHRPLAARQSAHPRAARLLRLSRRLARHGIPSHREPNDWIDHRDRIVDRGRAGSTRSDPDPHPHPSLDLDDGPETLALALTTHLSPSPSPLTTHHSPFTPTSPPPSPAPAGLLARR